MSGTQTILLVEDDNSVLIAGRAILKRLGYIVLIATSGNEALQIYQDNQNEITLVLTDVRMPEMDGLELYKALARINPTVKVLLMSAYDFPDLLANGLKGFVKKPFSFDSLGQAVRQALNEQ